MKSLTIMPPRSRKPDLAADLFGGAQIDLVGRFFGIVVRAEVSTVHVDGDERFGLVDHDRSAAAERHVPALDPRDFVLDVILVEQGLLPLVELDAVDVARHDDLHELAGPLEGLRLVDQHRIDLAVVDVADRADDHVAFFVDPDGARRLPDAADDRPPEPQQVVQVAMQDRASPDRCRPCE